MKPSKFLVDENLTPDLKLVLERHGHFATHINDVKKGLPIKDDKIRSFLLKYPDWVLMTKDDDFVKSYVSRKVPSRLIYIYGLDVKTELLAIVNQFFPDALNQLSAGAELIELNHNGAFRRF